jgi:hypothetical protein
LSSSQHSAFSIQSILSESPVSGNTLHLQRHPSLQRRTMPSQDNDAKKGAIEQDRPQQKTNTSLAGQNPHRDQDPLLKSANSDFPERGENEEHTGEPRTANQLDRDTQVNPEGRTQDQDPGLRQKENQNKRKDDPLAA